MGSSISTERKVMTADTELKSPRHFFYLAPIRGITDSLFRNIYHAHFPYFDAAVAPFINPQRHATFKDKYLADILPENNGPLEVVPQLLYNRADDFITLGRRLEDLGYRHINWNLGCPAPMVANKERGSGLLPHTERIVELLETILEALHARLSIKARLGFAGPEDIDRLLPRLESFPLKEIILHPRIGKQLYRGHADHDAFAGCTNLTSHQLAYNGDIVTLEDFAALETRFPNINRWMIGRGALADPFLVAAIRGIPIDEAERTSRLHDFHTDLYEQLEKRLNGPSHLLNRMKQIWNYLIGSFPDRQKILKKIQKASSRQKYERAVDEIFERTLS